MPHARVLFDSGIADGLSISLALGGSISATTLASIRVLLPSTALGNGEIQAVARGPVEAEETTSTVAEGLRKGMHRLALSLREVTRGEPLIVNKLGEHAMAGIHVRANST